MAEQANHGSTATWSGPVSLLEGGGLAMAGAILLAFRLHAFDLPLETDECNYIYIGSRLLAGDRLYVDVWDHQPFGVFVLFFKTFIPEPIQWVSYLSRSIISSS